MARKKISEFKAKTLLYQSLGIPYSGIYYSIRDSLDKFDAILDKRDRYVVKVDEGIKRRFKRGLVKLDVSFSQVQGAIKELVTKGYQSFLVEPYFAHKQADERYLAIERVREGYQVYYSQKGGIDVEEHQDSVKKCIIPFSFGHPEFISGSFEIPKQVRNDSFGSQFSHDRIRIARTINEAANYLNIKVNILVKLVEGFDRHYFSFLELNPFIILPAGKASHNSQFMILDAAVEVDSAAEFFAAHQSMHGSVDDTWSSADFVEGEVSRKTEEEKNIEELSSKSQASFKLDMLKPDGSIFMLLSGGGASIVLADEVANLGKGGELANYGEYSGNPNAEETYIYTKNLLSLLLKSSAKKKILLIAGGVANFTDVRITFHGIIKALEEVKDRLYRQNVKVFVRRGGPYQEEGLEIMKEFLKKEKLFGKVEGPGMVLTDIVTLAIKYLKD